MNAMMQEWCRSEIGIIPVLCQRCVGVGGLGAPIKPWSKWLTPSMLGATLSIHPVTPDSANCCSAERNTTNFCAGCISLDVDSLRWYSAVYRGDDHGGDHRGVTPSGWHGDITTRQRVLGVAIFTILFCRA